jgi:hypothetical protein
MKTTDKQMIVVDSAQQNPFIKVGQGQLFVKKKGGSAKLVNTSQGVITLLISLLSN